MNETLDVSAETDLPAPKVGAGLAAELRRADVDDPEVYGWLEENADALDEPGHGIEREYSFERAGFGLREERQTFGGLRQVREPDWWADDWRPSYDGEEPAPDKMLQTLNRLRLPQTPLGWEPPRRGPWRALRVHKPPWPPPRGEPPTWARWWMRSAVPTRYWPPKHYSERPWLYAFPPPEPGPAVCKHGMAGEHTVAEWESPMVWPRNLLESPDVTVRVQPDGRLRTEWADGRPIHTAALEDRGLPCPKVEWWDTGSDWWEPERLEDDPYFADAVDELSKPSNTFPARTSKTFPVRQTRYSAGLGRRLTEREEAGDYIPPAIGLYRGLDIAGLEASLARDYQTGTGRTTAEGPGALPPTRSLQPGITFEKPGEALRALFGDGAKNDVGRHNRNPRTGRYWTGERQIVELPYPPPRKVKIDRRRTAEMTAELLETFADGPSAGRIQRAHRDDDGVWHAGSRRYVAVRDDGWRRVETCALAAAIILTTPQQYWFLVAERLEHGVPPRFLADELCLPYPEVKHAAEYYPPKIGALLHSRGWLCIVYRDWKPEPLPSPRGRRAGSTVGLYPTTMGPTST